MNDSSELNAGLNGPTPDLNLLAFCYLTDDLSPAEQQAFELQLAAEQPAREALARAVELTAALRGVELGATELARPASTPVGPRRFERVMHTIAWAAIASAACLAVTIGLRALPGGLRALPGMFHNQPAVSPETALAWSQVRDTWPESAVADALSPADTNDASELPSAEDSASEVEVTSDMPGWLLAAVAGPDSEETNGSADEQHNLDPDHQEEL